MTEINFKMTVGSDVDFDDLIADITFENQLVALLTQEDGFQNLRIRIYPPKNKEFWDFRLNEFEKVIDRAKTRLCELQKTSDNSLNLSTEQ